MKNLLTVLNGREFCPAFSARQTLLTFLFIDFVVISCWPKLCMSGVTKLHTKAAR